MDLFRDSVIEELYSNIAISNMEQSEKYQKMLNEYNKLFESIEDKELKTKLEHLKELNNAMVSDSDKTTFKTGFSMGVKMLIEALNNNGTE